MFKKKLSMIACAITLGVTCFGLVSCGDDEEEKVSQEGHDSTKWFTDEELSKGKSIRVFGYLSRHGLYFLQSNGGRFFI